MNEQRDVVLQIMPVVCGGIMKKITLINGVEMPCIGLGAKVVWGGEKAKTSELAKNQYEIYAYALETRKCELFDTSGSYGLNEEILGNALHDTGMRKNVLLMTKIGNQAQREGNVREALENSLQKLQTDYIDIYLMHWPQTGTFIDTYLEMEKIYKEGLVKAIGVCNFHKHHFEELMGRATITPMVNEFEIHPLFTQESLINYCIAKDIRIIAYSPVGRMHDVLIKSKPVFDLSKKYGKTPVQIILRWHYQLGRVAIPCTLSKPHFDEIYEIETFSLTEKEIAWISSLNENIRLRYNPDTCDFSRLG